MCRSRSGSGSESYSKKFSRVGKSEILRHRHRCQNVLYLGQFIEISENKYSLSLHLVEMDTDPDPLKCCRIQGDTYMHDTYLVHGLNLLFL